jgi:ectoine hydroxylase-related dioxygenase (phytanoyl-CoA dioxygenase family)
MQMTGLRSEVDERGFVVLPAAVEPAVMNQLEDSLRESPLPRSRAGMRNALRHSAVIDIARSPVLLEVAREIVGIEAVPFKATLFDKSPISNWLVTWHQDTALPLQGRRELPEWGPWSVKDGVIYAHAPASALSKVVALRLHLDDSDSMNGPLRVLPGTHTLGVLSDQEIHNISNRTTPIDCLVPRGGLSVMRPLLIHASSKSRSEAPRRVLHVEYAAPGTIHSDLRLAMS